MSEAARRRSLWGPALAAFALALLVRVAPAGARFHETPDAVDYWSAARSLRRGDGFRLPSRGYIDDAVPGGPPTDIAHPAAYERSPLLPLLLAPFCGGERPSPWLQLLPSLCAAFAAAAAALCAGFLGRALGEERLASRASLLAGAMAALYPPLFWCSLRLLTEAPAAALFLGALALALSGEGAWRRASSGLCAGALVWARPDGLLAGALIAAFLAARDRAAPWRFSLGFLALALPCWLWGSWACGHPFPAQRFLLRVASSADVQWNYGAPTRPVTAALILVEASKNLGYYALALVLPKMTSIAAAPALVSLRSLRGPERDRALLVLMALVLILAKAAVWSTRDGMRFPVLSGLLLMIAGSVELGLWLQGRRGWLFVAVLLAAAAIPGARVLKRQSEPEEVSVWRNPGLAALAERPPQRTAASNPWALVLRSDAPALLLPSRLDAAGLFVFLDRFRVERVFLNPQAPHPGIEEPVRYRSSLAAAGWRRTALPGGAEIWSRDP